MMQYVPYIEGMHEGQGFNSYSQNPAGFNVVTIQQKSPEIPGHEIQMSSEYISEYQKLIQSLDITVGGAIGWFLRFGLGGGYLNRSEFEMSDFTYEVRVSIKRQSRSSRNAYKFNWYPEKQDEVHKYYGDRFISGFLTGGDYFARCSIKMNSNCNRTEWKKHADLAFSMFNGISIDISPQVRKAVESLHQNAEIKITRYIRGGGSMSETDTITDLLALREEAFKFYNNPDRQNFRISAIVEDYFILPDFRQEYFTPKNYSYARVQSWPLFNDFTFWNHLELLIDSIPEENFPGNKRQWASECLELQKGIVDGIEKVVEDPEKLGRVLHWPRRKPDEFMAKLMEEVSSTYELRSILVEERFDGYTPQKPAVFTAGWTAAIYLEGEPLNSSYETIVGKFRAFSFPFPGTLLVSLGYQRPEDCIFHWGRYRHDATSRSGFWINRAQTGNRISDGDVVKETSYFWAFPSNLPHTIQKSIGLVEMQRMNISIVNDPPSSGSSPKTLLNISMLPLSTKAISSKNDQGTAVLHVPEQGYTRGYELSNTFSVHVLADTV